MIGFPGKPGELATPVCLPAADLGFVSVRREQVVSPGAARHVAATRGGLSASRPLVPALNVPPLLAAPMSTSIDAYAFVTPS